MIDMRSHVLTGNPATVASISTKCTDGFRQHFRAIVPVQSQRSVADDRGNLGRLVDRTNSRSRGWKTGCWRRPRRGSSSVLSTRSGIFGPPIANRAASRQISDRVGGLQFSTHGALAMLLVGHFLLIALLATHRIVLASTEEGLFDPVGHQSLRYAIFAMCLLFVFGRLEGNTSQAAPRRWSTLINILAAFAIVVLAAILF